MASKQLSTLRSEVRDDLGSPPTDTISDTQIDTRINYSYREVATRFRHPEIETSETINTSDGTQSESVASDYWYTYILRDEDNDAVLTYKDLPWIVAQDTDSKGQPEFYTNWGTNILLYPTPDAAYSLTNYYVKHVSSLSADADQPVVNEAWDEVIKWGAVWRCHQMLGEQDKMVHSRNIWRTLVNNMPETESLAAERSVQVAGLIGDSSVPHWREGPHNQ